MPKARVSKAISVQARPQASAAKLGDTLTLPCGAVIKNRLMKSAMSEALGQRGGAPGQELVRLYRAWAEGCIGLCVTGNVMIDRRALGEPGNVVIEDARWLTELSAWAEAGRAHGTALWMQINHPGKQSPRGLNRETVSPSAVPFAANMQAMFATPRALLEAEIEDLIRRYGATARVARDAGFTGVQIHGAHGYLVSQFLSPHYNRRSDAWGGDAPRRRRFALAVLGSIREACGPDFPIGIKLNSADFLRGGFTHEESLDTVQALSEAGIDLIEISGGSYEAPVMTGVTAKTSTVRREAYFLEFAESARARSSRTPLAVTGGFRSVGGMAAALASGATDLIGLGRSLAIEPDLPQRLLRGQEPRQMVRPIKTGIPMVDRMGLMEVAWYTRQLKRIGRGAAPRPDESGLLSFLHYAVASGLDTARLRRQRATA